MDEGPLELLILEYLPQVANGDAFEKIEMGIEFPDFPDHVAVYAVATPDIDRAQAAEIAQMLNVSDDVREMDHQYRASNPDRRMLSISRQNGTVDFTTRAWEDGNTPMTNILTPTQYEKIAIDWLERTGLSSDAMRFKGTSENTRSHLLNGDTVTETVMISVNFDHEPIDGHEFQGIGPKWSVFFHDAAEVIGVMSVWKEIGKLIGNYPIVSASEAFDKILDGDGEVYGDRSGQNATVDSVEIVYYSHSTWYTNPQTRFVPYYKFEGNGSGGERFSALTVALRENYYRMPHDFDDLQQGPQSAPRLRPE